MRLTRAIRWFKQAWHFQNEDDDNIVPVRFPGGLDPEREVEVNITAYKLVKRHDGTYDLIFAVEPDHLYLENEFVQTVLFSAYDLLKAVEMAHDMGVALPNELVNKAFGFRLSVREASKLLNQG